MAEGERMENCEMLNGRKLARMDDEKGRQRRGYTKTR